MRLLDWACRLLPVLACVLGLVGTAHAQQSIQYLALAGGDPGLPGDGVYAAAGPGSGFQLAQPQAISNFPNGFTLTLWRADGAGFWPQRSDYVDLTFQVAGSSCTADSAQVLDWLVTAYGVEGGLAQFQPSNLQSVADQYNTYCQPAVAVTPADLQLTGFVVIVDPNNAPTYLTSLDAVALGNSMTAVPAGPAAAIPTDANHYIPLAKGDPGVPGDGKVVATDFAGQTQNLNPFFALGAASNGLTITVFAGDQSALFNGASYLGAEIEVRPQGMMCTASKFVAARETLVVNGSIGEDLYVSPADIQQLLGALTQGCSASLTVNDLMLSGFKIYAQNVDGSTLAITSIDAVGWNVTAGQIQAPKPKLSLSPAGASPYTLSQQCVSALLQDNATGAPLANVPVLFTINGVNPGSKTQNSDNSGKTQLCWTGNASGTDTVTASSGSATVTAVINWVKRPVAIHTQGFINVSLGSLGNSKLLRFTAQLSDGLTGAPVAGRTVSFVSEGRSACQAITDASGNAICSTWAATFYVLLTGAYQASFAGDPAYLPASASGTLLSVGQ